MASLVQQLAPNAAGSEVANLHEVLGALGYAVDAAEMHDQLYGASTAEAVRAFQRDHALPDTGIVDSTTADLLASSPAAARLTRVVSGAVVFEYGLPAGGIDLRAYTRGYGGKDALLAETKTQSDGSYSLSYRAADPVNLELRTVDPAGREISLSETKFGAGRSELIRVVAPAAVRPLAPEYARLAADLEQIGGVAALAQASESGGRQDLSIVHELTHWDARLVALAAQAQQLARQTKQPAELLYGLFRAGLPTDPVRLARVGDAAVATALDRVVRAGIVQGRIAKTAPQTMKALRAAYLGASKTAGTPSSFADLLRLTGLSEQEQQAFEQLYLETPQDELWKRAAETFPPEVVDRLRAQGKLAALTLNNAPLIARLQEHVRPGADLAALVDAGYHAPAAWEALLRELGRDAVDSAVPSAYVADTPEDRVAAYAADLARKVRLAFPTRVVGQLFEDGTLKLGNDGASVGTFLKNASQQGFELARSPISQIAAGADATMLDAVRTVQRVYQITPSNEAMGVLLDGGLVSARDVVSLGVDRFRETHGGKFVYPGEGDWVWQRSEQISSVTYGLFTTARGLDSSTPVQTVSGDASARQTAKDSITKQYPSMAQLFGSLDFCECAECRSVLSPAAYLVDLLQYVNPSKTVWDAFTAQWNADHAKTFAAGFAADYDKPFDQLDRRRPDLKSLPLTCENTNTALPYIDVVNEILEYRVAHGSLAGDAGNDTGEATSEELIAEPQYVIPQAYQTLLGRKYPIGLPFDLWIETVRGFLAYFDLPLWRLLETFRATDELFAPTGGTAPYYRSQIFVESLGISPAEWAVYTAADPAGSWWTLYGDYANENDARTDLASAKTLARVLGLTYRELTDLVETEFVNPELAKLVTLSKIGIDVGDVYRYENAPSAQPMSPGERAAFEQQLADFQTATGFDAAAWLASTYGDGTFDKILVLADPDPGCNFDATTLQYANGQPATAVDFVKLNLFVRLWRRLGWNLRELDPALSALLPAGALPLSDASLPAALGTAIVYLSHLETLADALSLGASARLRLPVLWTDIPTRGANSLYAQLFLTPSALKNDPIFDDPTGDYLHDATKLLEDHRLGVQAALALTSGDVDAILADAGVDAHTAPLSLPNVSLLYRYGLLARALKVTVPDLVTLKRLSGLDPFAPIGHDPLNADPGSPPLATIDDDHPFSQTIRFVDVAAEVAASGFSIAELEYLLVHDPDAVARFRPDESPALDLVRTLRRGIGRIVADNSPPDDPTTLDDETLRQKLALVLPAQTVETLMAMWQGTVRFNAVQENVLPADALDPAPLAPFPLTVSYDAVRQEQRLTFTGVLLDPQKTAITTADGAPLLAGLLADVQAQATDFFGRWCGSFLSPGDFDTLFAPIPADPAAAEAAIAARRAAMAAGLYPFLRARLVRQLVVTTLAAAFDADPVLVEALVGDTSLLYDATAAPGTDLLAALAAAGTPGLSAEWYASTDCTGAMSIEPAPTVAAADTASKPAGTQSARFRGCVQVTDGGPYRLYVHLDKQNASATVSFESVANPIVSTTAAADGAEASGEIDLKAGVPYPFTIELHDLGGGDARVEVAGETLPRDTLAKLTLYPQSVVDGVRHADVVLAKVLRLLSGLALDQTEIAYLLAHGADFDDLDLSQLPSVEATSGASERFGQFLRLAGYAALKAALGLDGDDLVDVFAHARRTYDAGANAGQAESDVLADVCARVATLTRRDPATVETVAAQLGFAAGSAISGGALQVQVPDLVQERGLRRLWDALAALQSLGVDAGAIGRWVPIVDGGAAGRDEIADDVKKTVKARFEEDAWYRVAQPVFDGLRKLKRDALVAYILDAEKLESADELYEQFLLDPEMEPVVQTSRIQLAISSVQLFVQRCLLNLEERVPPAAIIDADEWQWMKRYRVWDANRQIFLYPENWLEPEFRLDKTSLFGDLESSLLQGDVTPDAAEDAFLAYLQTLESIARLEIVSMYIEEPDDGDEILHVLARTHAGPHVYYYRTFSDRVWEPWTPVDVEIEGDHVALVKWRDRVHAFWITFVEKTEHTALDATPNDLASRTSDAVMQQSVEIRLSWSSLVQGAWTPRASAPPFSTIETTVSKTFTEKSVPIWISKETRADGSEGGVRIHVGGPIGQAFRIATKNSAPTVFAIVDDQPPVSYYSANTADATLLDGSGALSIYYPERITQDGAVVEEDDATQTILGAAPNGDFELLLADSPLRLPRPDLAPLAAPFFYADDTNTFFVAPEVTETTFEEWQSWIVGDGYGSSQGSLGWLGQIPVQYQVPNEYGYPPVGPDPGDPLSKYEVQGGADWVTDPATLLDFGGTYVYAQGGIGVTASTGAGRSTTVEAGAGSSVGSGTMLGTAMHGNGTEFTRGSSVLLVGGAGFNGASAATLHHASATIGESEAM